jgi:hypothetical protein
MSMNFSKRVHILSLSHIGMFGMFGMFALPTALKG